MKRHACILVLNAGSSSLKFSLFVHDEKLSVSDTLHLYCRGQVEGLYQRPHFLVRNESGAVLHEQSWDDAAHFGHDQAINVLHHWLRENLSDYELLAVGHRVVHGGEKYEAPLKISQDIVNELAKLIPLAPLHQPHNLAPIKILSESSPQLLQIACFDTSFHASQSALARAYALPKAITEKGVKRYGFHGLSYEYIASFLSQKEPELIKGKVIVMHLGNGASMTAMDNGKSVATTMGFTGMDGLPMGTRCGSLDPGVVLYLISELGMDPVAVQKMFYNQSGLLGVSGIASDMRTLLESSEESACFAIDLFVYRIAREIGSLAAALGGLDAIVFTGGIGEHAAIIREKICEQARWLNVAIDQAANRDNSMVISSKTSKVELRVIPTNEELMIAQHVLNFLSA